MMTDYCEKQFVACPSSQFSRVGVRLRTAFAYGDMYGFHLFSFIGAEAEPVPQLPREGTGADSDARLIMRTFGEGVCWICVITSKLVTR